MSLKNNTAYQLEVFRKFLTDALGIQEVEYTSQGQVYSRNLKKPWVQLEMINALRSEYGEESEDNGDTIRLKSTVVHRVLINVHSRFVENDQFQTLAQSIELQSILYHSEVTKFLSDFEISVVEPDELIETLPTITFDSIEFDKRFEPDTWFPMILSLGNQVESPLLDVGWFNTVLLSTDIHDLANELQLDDERIPE